MKSSNRLARFDESCYLFRKIRINFCSVGVHGPSEYTIHLSEGVQPVWVEQHMMQFHILLCVISQHLHEALQKQKVPVSAESVFLSTTQWELCIKFDAVVGDFAFGLQSVLTSFI
jgi:hypothetical protein